MEREQSPQETIDAVCARLEGEFSGLFAAETITRVVTDSYDSLAGSKIHTFVPLFVHRFSRERLTALAQSEGAMPKDVPEVVFVCLHDGGRSQMAAALMARVAAGAMRVHSAGSHPADEVYEGVKQALSEVGAEISEGFPKPLTDEVLRAADVVVILGGSEDVPRLPGKRYVGWELDVSTRVPVEEVRPIRDELDRKVRTLFEELVRDYRNSRLL